MSNKITREESLKIINILTIFMFFNGKVLEKEFKYIDMIANELDVFSEVSKIRKNIRVIYSEENTIGLEVLLDNLINEIKTNEQIIYNLSKKLAILDYYITKIELKYLDKMKEAWNL